MTGHNQPPAHETFSHQEMLQFDDQQLALIFRTPGDVLVLGPGSSHKHAQHFFEGMQAAIIQTRSGNQYGLANGLEIDQNRSRGYPLSEDDLHITIGEPVTIPNVGSTTDVVGVMLRYKIGDLDYAERIAGRSPFVALETRARYAYDAVYGTSTEY